MSFVLLLSSLLLLSLPALSSAQGIALKAGVEGARMNWSDELGLDDTSLLGAYADMEFGRYVRLQLGLGRANNVNTRLGDAGLALAENRVDVTRAGTRVLLRLGSGAIAPLLAGSGGLIRMEPDNRERVDQLFVGWGGGIGLRPWSWLDAQLLLEDVYTRLDRSRLSSDPAAGPDPAANDRRRNLMASLGLALRVGGRGSQGAEAADRAMSNLTQGSVEGLLVPLELRGGILRFDDEFRLDDQPTAAVSLGVGLGPYFGLRGSYLRGGFGTSGRMDGWSGEAIFSVGRMTSLSPYLLLGYGELSFDEDFLNDMGSPVPDQSAFIAGGGIGVALSDRIRLTASLKDYITSSGDLDQASSASELRHSFGLEAGLSYLLVGHRADRSVPAAMQEPEPPVPGADEERVLAAQPDTSFRQGALDSVQVGDTVQVVDTVGVGMTDVAAAATDTMAVAAEATDTAATEPTPADTTLLRAQSATPDSADTGYQSDRSIVIPIPAEGEIYIRYGPPPARDEPGTAITPSLPVSPTIPASDTVAGGDPTSATTPTAPDSATLALIIRRELERLTEEASRETPGVRADATDDRIDRLAEEVRLLTQLLREGATVERAGEGVGTVVALPAGQGAGVGSVTVLPPERRGYLLDAGVGWGSHRDGGAGLSATVDLSRLEPWLWRLRPYAGIELTWSSVQPTVGSVTANGSVTTIAAGVGSYLNLPDIGPVTPSLSLGLQGMGGSVDGDTPADQDILDALHDAFSLGVSGGMHLAYQRPESESLLALALRRHWAGDRSRWSMQAGVRIPVFGGGTTLGTVSYEPASPDRTVERGETPAPVGPTPGDTTSTETRTDSTVLARLDSLEQALARERQARIEAQEAAAAPPEPRVDTLPGVERIRVDSLAATVDSLRAAAEDRRQAERDEQALRAALNAVAATFPSLLQVGATDGRTVVTLGGDAFEVASATLDPRAERAIEQVADLLRSASQGPVLVEGHTDATGPEETNMNLSRARAQTVRAILVQQGVEGSRIEAVGMGEAEPVATNETADGRSRNRRVEIVLMGGATPQN